MGRQDDALDAAINAGTKGALLDVWTQARGNVVSYDEATKTCEIKLAMRFPVPDGDGGHIMQDLPNLTNVPVAWIAAGGFLFHLPLAAGDAVYVTFDGHDAQPWEKTGLTSDVTWFEQHGMSSPLAHPYSRLPIASDGANMVCPTPFSFGNVASAKFLAWAETVDANFQKIADMFSTWVIVPNDGGGALKTLSGSLSFDPVACTKVKSE